MKNLIRYILVLVALASISIMTFAQTKQIFSGKIRLKDNSHNSTDTMVVRYKLPFTPASDDFTNIRVYSNRNGDFQFHLPDASQPYKLMILIKHSKGYVRLATTYFTEPKDNIKIDIVKGENSDLARFYGKGAEKYNLSHKLDSLRLTYRNKRLDLSEDLTEKLLQLNLLTREYDRERNHVIKYSGANYEIQRMLNYEHEDVFSDWVMLIHSFYVKYINDELKKAIVKNSYSEFKSEFIHPIDTLMSLCPSYVKFLGAEESKRMIMEASSLPISLESLYKRLTDKYSGALRQQLITNLFTNYIGINNQIKFDQNTFDSLMKDAEQIVKIPVLKQALFNRLRRLKGEKLLNTSFVDLDGKQFDLSSLKGKVVLIDLWSVGCSWCAKFHKSFHENVYPLIKNNKDFVYLSVNTNSTKERWQEGLNGGLYTSMEYINISLGKNGMEHPFIKYYNVVTLPFTLLIDKNGDIYADSIFDPEKAYQLINKALSDII